MKTGKVTHFVVQGLHNKLQVIIVSQECVLVSKALLAQPCKCQVKRSGA